MTISERPASGGNEIPLIGGSGPTKPPQQPKAPPDRDPFVSIGAISGRVVAGTPLTITVDLDEGEHQVWHPVADGGFYEPVPKVQYTGGLDVSIDGAAQVQDHQTLSGGVTETVTFPAAGDHTLTATGIITGGNIVSHAMSVHVAASGPPAFTLAAPVDGTVVPLGAGGGNVVVQLTTTSDYFPLTAAITRDGVTTSAQFSSAQFQTTINLAPMPLGPRTISVAVADRDGLSSAQSRSVTGQDIAPPVVAVSDPVASANIPGDATGAVTKTVVGTATDVQSGMAGGSAAVAWALSPTGTRTPRTPSRATISTAGAPTCRWPGSVRTRSACGRPIRPATRRAISTSR